LTDTDPQVTGVAPLPVRAADRGSQRSAEIANQFVEQARCLLASDWPANMVMLRGFARLPALLGLTELYGIRAGAIALHGMYRGVAKLAGMQVLPVPGNTLDEEFATLERHWADFDFFYLHVKKTDTYGEQGDFDAKVKAIEEVDALLPRLLALDPNVVIVGGDHSSPAVLRSHSWHPVPVLLYGAHVRPDGIPEFGERACARGSLGVLPATHLLPLALANAGRILKYGA
jgi:2,3-bisphosphoglycerate-independent phosphoglycerate mutase